jgi:hypothetical protein
MKHFLLRIPMGRGRQTGGRQELSEFIRQSNESRPMNEHGIRSAMLVIPAAALLTIYFGCLWLLPGLSGSLAAFPGAALLLSSFAVHSTELHWLSIFAARLGRKIDSSTHSDVCSAHASVLNQKFVTKLAVGRTPSSALDTPGPAFSITRETRADGGVGRGPGAAPHPGLFNEPLTQDTSARANPSRSESPA